MKLNIMSTDQTKKLINKEINKRLEIELYKIQKQLTELKVKVNDLEMMRR